jgi:hypothetical protein
MGIRSPNATTEWVTLSGMLLSVRTGLLILGTALCVSSGIGMAASGAPVDCEKDGRCRALKTFFARQGSPLQAMASVFIEKADRYGLDWRLLPGIAMVESSGGKHYRRNNIFGWNSGRTGFRTVAAGIDFVASRFVLSPIYRGRTSRGILAAYNPAPQKYPPKVIRFMEMMEASPVK